MGEDLERERARSWKSARLDRAYPGERPEDLLIERLMERVPAALSQRVCAGETARLSLGRSEARYTRRVADPAPNTPLLMRLMRNPYVEDVVRPQRKPGRQGVPWEDVRRRRRERAAAWPTSSPRGVPRLVSAIPSESWALG